MMNETNVESNENSDFLVNDDDIDSTANGYQLKTNSREYEVRF